MENLVKKWEMQASHFKDFSQWSEIDHDNYTVSVNGGDVVDGSVAYEIGNYNALMADCPAYKKCKKYNFLLPFPCYNWDVCMETITERLVSKELLALLSRRRR